MNDLIDVKDRKLLEYAVNKFGSSSDQIKINEEYEKKLIRERIRNKRMAYSKRKFIIALRECQGIVSNACKKLGIPREWFNICYKKSKVFRDHVDAVSQDVVDYVELKLLEAVEDNNVPAIIFYMKCKGKSRGFTEKSENEVTGDIKLEIRKTITREKK